MNIGINDTSGESMEVDLYHRTVSVPRLAQTASRRKGLWRLAFLAVALVIFASYVAPVRSYLERARQVEQETAVTSQLRQQHDKLTQERAQLQNNSYVEEVARRDLGLVRAGEQPFVVKELDQGDKAAGSPPDIAGVDLSWNARLADWLGGLLP
ncbi:MAG: FtsB family cell division protein [Thermoleophilia bacterium]